MWLYQIQTDLQFLKKEIIKKNTPMKYNTHKKYCGSLHDPGQ